VWSCSSPPTSEPSRRRRSTRTPDSGQLSAETAEEGKTEPDGPRSLSVPSALIEKAAEAVREHGRVGLLSVNLIETGDAQSGQDWRAYETLVAHLRDFLATAGKSILRREDKLLEVVVNGNAFVLLIAPPRSGGPMRFADVSRVKERLQDRIRTQLREKPAWLRQERFGCFVGSAILDGTDPGQIETRVWAALDRALADALHSRDVAGSSRADLVRDLIASGSLHAVYQPIADLEHRAVLGYEALSRPEMEAFRKPDSMLKAAADSGLLWAAERLCRRRIIEGISGKLGRAQYLFMNVEPESLEDPEFRDAQILQVFERAGLAPERIVLEMTEHSSVNDFSSFRKTIFFFRSLGFKIAIDDMGAGFSGLKSLAEINPEFIKVDLSLVRDIHLSPIKQEMLAMIQQFASNTGSTLISEGVEKLEEARTLRKLAIRFAQGYLFAHPSRELTEPDLSCLDR
jgi:EAL domain-containing protein (putative c-di-GMP-specific phosphodiesterase class I)